jgi:hypothetical protein
MKIIKYEENLIEFDNGCIIEFEHVDECCEHVYADCEYLSNYNILPHTGETIKIGDIDFPEDIENNIIKVEGEGVKLKAKDGSVWFIPCYDEQNGYYSSDLSIRVNNKYIDITGCTKEIWC